MPKIYALGGVSGVGKTFLREQHWLLSTLPHLDIADMYDKHGAADYVEALDMFVKRIIRQLSEHPKQDIVLEAFFSDRQRRRIEEVVEAADAEINLKVSIQWVWLHADRETCRLRVEEEQNDTEARRSARLRMIGNMAEYQFEERPEESPDLLPEEPSDDNDITAITASLATANLKESEKSVRVYLLFASAVASLVFEFEAMPNIYALEGVSGVGKTFLREQHWLLSTLPYLDIADMYDKHGAADYVEALDMFVERLIRQLSEHPKQDIVLEASFSDRQRRRIEEVVEAGNMPSSRRGRAERFESSAFGSLENDWKYRRATVRRTSRGIARSSAGGTIRS
eukprot:gene12454-15659_t